MIRHILKLLWKKKKNNYLLLIEIFFSFLVLFIISSLLTSSLNRYYNPLGYKFNNIISLSVLTASREDSLNISAILKEIKSMPEVESVCLDKWNSTPYSYNNQYGQNSFKNISKKLSEVKNGLADDDFARVFKLEVVEGRWFSKEDDNGSVYKPVVINNILKNELFGNGKAVGKLLEPKEDDGTSKVLKIIGVIKNYKTTGEFGSEKNFMFFREVRKGDYGFYCPLFMRTRYNVPVYFEKKLYGAISLLYPDAKIEIERFETIRKKYIASDIRQMIVFSTIGAFLIINVVLGLFGILWYNISRRRKEIGLRRAVGADKRKVFILITGEIIALTSISILCGCVFAVQFPAVNFFSVSSGIYYTALLAAILFIYFVIILCSVYPGYLASVVEPAAALHED